MFSSIKKITDVKNIILHFIKIKEISKLKKKFLEYLLLHPWKTLILIYILFISFKILLTQLFLDPSNLVDGFIYMKMAQSFFQGENFEIYGLPTHKYPPLYSILISPSYIFKDTIIIFRVIRILSVLYSTLIIFPAYLIAKEFLNKKKSIVVSIVISCLAGANVWVFNVVSECVFYPLFLFTVYFIYKSVFESGYKFKIISGLFIGLCFLTRYTSIVFGPAVIILFIIVHLKEKKYSIKINILQTFKDCLIVFITMIFVIMPWLLRNGIIYGYNIRGMLGYAGEITSSTDKIMAIFGEFTFSGQQTYSNDGIGYIQNFLTHFLIDHGIIILACGIIFFIMAVWLININLIKRKSNIFILTVITLILIESLIIIDSIHNINIPWRLHGRYLEPVFPLIIILGSIGLTKIKYLNQKKIYLYLFFSLPFSILLANTWGFMGGMISVSYIGIFQNLNLYFSKFFGLKINFPFDNFYKIIIFVLILLLFFLFFILIKYRFSKRKIFAITTLLLVLSTTISVTGYIVRDAYTSNSELYDFGMWLNSEYSGKNVTIYFDEGIEFAINQISIWLNAPTYIYRLNENLTIKPCYLISNNIFNFTKIYQANLTSSLNSEIFGRNNWQYEIYIYKIN